MKINEKLPILRKRKGYSQEDLAHELDVSRQAVYKWEVEESTPELDKIKKMSIVFDISFDDLLNDEIDITKISNNKETKKETKFRKVYVSNQKFSYENVEIENGYIPKRNVKNKKRKQIVAENEEKLQKFLKENNYKEVVLLQHDSTATFFVDSKNKAVGFYFDGCVQFLLPIENFVSINIKSTSQTTYEKESLIGIGSILSVGSRKVPTGSRVSSFLITISYFNENSSIEKYEFNLSCSRLFNIIESMKDYEFENDMLSQFTSAAVNRLKEMLENLKIEAALLKEKNAKLEELDIEALTKANEKQEQKNIEYRESLKQDWKKYVKKKWIKRGIIWGAVAIFLLICCL